MRKKNPKKTAGRSPFSKAIEEARKSGLPRRKERMNRIEKLRSKGFDVDGFMKATVVTKKQRRKKR